MYSGPIIDPHHHLWDLSMDRHAWLKPSDPTAKALAGLESIAHDYLPADYSRDSARHAIVATVHIEGVWSGDPVEETRWLETLDKSQGIASRYVGAAKLGSPEAAGLIAQQAAFPRMTGIRSILSWHADPEFGRTPEWRRDAAIVARHGLNLELMVYPQQFDIVCEAAAAMPDLQIIINHCGSPIDRDAAGMRRWRESIEKISGYPNVAIKVSNPGAYDHNWTLESVREVAMHVHRLLRRRPHDVRDRLSRRRHPDEYDQIYDTFKTIASVLPAADQAKLFHDTAKRLYRL